VLDFGISLLFFHFLLFLLMRGRVSLFPPSISLNHRIIKSSNRISFPQNFRQRPLCFLTLSTSSYFFSPDSPSSPICTKKVNRSHSFFCHFCVIHMSLLAPPYCTLATCCVVCIPKENMRIQSPLLTVCHLDPCPTDGSCTNHPPPPSPLRTSISGLQVYVVDEANLPLTSYCSSS
jgi:hypothetical protein